MKRILLIITALMLLLVVPQVKPKANGVTYNTFTYSSNRKSIVPTQDAYIPISMTNLLGGITLKHPEDIFIDDHDNIFIADTGNKRVIRYDLKNDQTFIIGEGILREPKGIHIGIDGSLYVADYGLRQGVKFSYNQTTHQYEKTEVYQKPINSPYFTEEDPFYPTKIITDNGNNVYLVLSGNINGLAEFKNDGEFFGFFGGNRFPSTFENIVKQNLFDKETRRKWFKMVPNPVYNAGIDNNGLVITISKGQSGYLKLNIANLVYSESNWGKDDLEDITVGPYNTIFAIGQDGRIYEYTNEGELLFMFSGQNIGAQKGLFQAPSGIAVDSKNNLYAIDSKDSTLQIFSPTIFADLVHKAIDYYQQGLYSDSKVPWQEVLKMNVLFDVANKGLGDAYYAEGNYEEAMTYYELSRDVKGYSDAYWEVRNKSLLGSAEWIVYVIIGIIVLMIVNHFVSFTQYMAYPFKVLNKELSYFKTYREIKHNFYVLKKPADGYYGIKREKKSSNLTALIMLLLFFASYLIFIYFTKFTFNDRIISEINLLQEIIKVFVPIGLWVIANYLVSSIREGEGTLSNVFQGTVTALLPMTITFPIVTIVSQVLTLNEGFIYQTLLFAGIGVTALYLVLMVKEIHFYDTKPTLGNIFISIFTAVMMLVMIIIVYILLSEVINLFLDIIKEVTNRA